MGGRKEREDGAGKKSDRKEEEGEEEGVGPRSKVSLLDQHSELKKKAEGKWVCFFRRITHAHNQCL